MVPGQAYAMGDCSTGGRHRTAVSGLLGLLSRAGGLEILKLAEKGIKTDAKLDLVPDISRGQFEARLSELARAGLIERAGDSYVQTRLGRALWHKYIPRLEKAIAPGAHRCKLSNANKNQGGL